MGPTFGADAFGQPADRIPDGGRLEGASQECQLGTDIPAEVELHIYSGKPLQDGDLG
jgi:hypothetical protein